MSKNKTRVIVSSHRKYNLVFISPKGSVLNDTTDLTDIINVDTTNGDAEFLAALNDRLDDVINLAPGQRMEFQPNRDDIESYAIIVRYE